MATVSIGALRYDIIADTVNFEKGLFRTRKEMRAAEKVFRRNQTAQEKYANSIARTDVMLRKGAITTKAHAREVKRLTREYRESHTVMGKMGKAMRSRLGLFALATSAMMSLRSAFRKMNEDISDVDKLDKAAKTMGESAQNIQAIQFAAQQTVSFTDDQTIDAIEKMTKRIAEAAQGMGEAQSALKMLRLDARKLVLLRPYKQFLVLSDAIDGVADAGSRAVISQKLFDASARRFHVTMKGGAKAIEAYKKQAQEMGIVLGDETIEDMVNANDAVGRMSKAWDRLSKVLSGTAAPALESIADRLSNIAELLAKIQKLREVPGFGLPFATVGEQLKDAATGEFHPAMPAKGTTRAMTEWLMKKLEPDEMEYFPEFDEDTSWMRKLIPARIRSINERNDKFTERVEGMQDSFLMRWWYGDAASTKKFKLPPKPDPSAKDGDGDGSGADSDSLGLQSLVKGTTAEQDSVEEYRFLVEKQQRENAALMLTGNTKALIENTNALLNTTDREGVTRPIRTPESVMLGVDLQL